MAIKKGPTKGSGGKHRNKLKGYGPTPKAEDRVYHKAYKAKKAAERRQMADPRLAARRRVDKFASADTSDLGVRPQFRAGGTARGRTFFHAVHHVAHRA